MAQRSKQGKPSAARGDDRASSGSGETGLDLPTGNSIGYLVRETHRAFQRVLEPKIERFGISSGMWWFLRALWERDGVSQTQLSETVRVMGPTTVRALERMEQRGLIERRREGADSRKLFIYLTPEGRALRKKLTPIMIEVQEQATGHLSAGERETLRALLTKVRQGLE